MARIVLSDLAPTGESLHFSLANTDFDIGGSGKGTKKSYDTSDRAVLANAEVHPWLSVEYDEAEQVGGEFLDNQVAPEDDPLSAAGPNANIPFDPDEIRKVENAKRGVTDAVAIDAGKDQDEVVETGGVAETVAADNADDGKGE